LDKTGEDLRKVIQQILNDPYQAQYEIQKELFSKLNNSCHISVYSEAARRNMQTIYGSIMQQFPQEFVSLEAAVISPNIDLMNKMTEEEIGDFQVRRQLYLQEKYMEDDVSSGHVYEAEVFAKTIASAEVEYAKVSEAHLPPDILNALRRKNISSPLL
jgi:hypothetical protein